MKINLKNFIEQLDNDSDIAQGEYKGYVIYVCEAGGKAQKTIENGLPAVEKPKAKKRTVEGDDDD